MSGYVEARDAKGRTMIAISSSGAPIGLLVAGGVVMLLPAFAMGFKAVLLVLGFELFLLAILIVASVAAGSRSMRVTIDPAARTIAVGTGGDARVLPFAEVARAQLNSVLARRPRHERHRVDLELRSGEVLPLMKGYSSFPKEDYLRMIDRINAALAAPR